MKDKSKALLIVVIILVTALIAYVCYGIFRGNKNPIVTMEVSYIDSEGKTKNGTVKIELYPDSAPETVANFIALANNGYYDGLTFHRIVKDFVVQGGDKNGDGSGSASYRDLFASYTIKSVENDKITCENTKTKETKEIKASDLPEKIKKLPKEEKEGKILLYKDGKYQIEDDVDNYTYSIKGEFAANGVNNDVKFGKGIIGMARSDYSSYGLTEEGYNSASSQFFVVTTDDKASLNSLNQNYASFGKVIEGYEFIEEIGKLYSEEADGSTNNTSTEITESGEVAENVDGNTEVIPEKSNESDEQTEKNVPKTTRVRVDTFGVNYKLPNALNFDQTLNTISQYQSFYQQLNQQYQNGTTEVE
ncbi:MAG: peptidylprolyl isomerase [Clostridia bacterium]|nr:peptidylprolyl isomerase [Clostridia bacterium]